MSGSNGKSFFLGAIVGGIIGGVTALLFAPKSGEKFRKDLARTYHNVSEKTQDLVEEVSHQTKELVEKARGIAEDAKEAAQNLINDIRKKK